MEILLRHALEGLERTVTELGDPDKSWQIRLITRTATVRRSTQSSCQTDLNIWVLQTTPEVATKYGRRWFGLDQENCLFAAHALLCRDPPPSRQFKSDIVTSKPVLLDLLLDCAVLPRTPWYPECDMDEVGEEWQSQCYL